MNALFHVSSSRSLMNCPLECGCTALNLCYQKILRGDATDATACATGYVVALLLRRGLPVRIGRAVARVFSPAPRFVLIMHQEYVEEHPRHNRGPPQEPEGRAS